MPIFYPTYVGKLQTNSIYATPGDNVDIGYGSGVKASFQTDGNLVFYNGTSTIFNVGTTGMGTNVDFTMNNGSSIVNGSGSKIKFEGSHISYWNTDGTCSAYWSFGDATPAFNVSVASIFGSITGNYMVLNGDTTRSGAGGTFLHIGASDMVKNTYYLGINHTASNGVWPFGIESSDGTAWVQVDDSGNTYIHGSVSAASVTTTGDITSDGTVTAKQISFNNGATSAIYQDTGVGNVVFHVNDGTTDRYFQIQPDGTFNITNVNASTSGYVQGGRVLATQGLPRSMSGFTFIQEGDYDTGMFSDGDGKLYLYANNVRVVSFNSSSVVFNVPATFSSTLTSTGNAAAPLFLAKSGTSGGYVFNGDTTTGVFSTGSGNVSIQSAGTSVISTSASSIVLEQEVQFLADAIVKDHFTLRGVDNNNRGIEIGLDSSATAYIDLHSQESAFVDYDARIMCVGGTAASGGGAVTISAKNVSILAPLDVTGTFDVSGAISSSGTLSASGAAFGGAVSTGTYGVSIAQSASDTVWPFGIIRSDKVTLFTVDTDGGIVTGSNANIGGYINCSDYINVSAAAGNNRTIAFQTAGSPRWGITVSSAAESGSNVGSDLLISRSDDTGTFIDNPLSITRSTGVAKFSALVSTPGITLTNGGTSSIYQDTNTGNIVFHVNDGTTDRYFQVEADGTFNINNVNGSTTGYVQAGQVLAAQGVPGSSGGFTFIGDSGKNTGLYSPSSGALDVYAGGTSVVSATSTSITATQPTEFTSTLTVDGFIYGYSGLSVAYKGGNLTNQFVMSMRSDTSTTNTAYLSLYENGAWHEFDYTATGFTSPSGITAAGDLTVGGAATVGGRPVMTNMIRELPAGSDYTIPSAGYFVEIGGTSSQTLTFPDANTNVGGMIAVWNNSDYNWTVAGVNSNTGVIVGVASINYIPTHTRILFISDGWNWVSFSSDPAMYG